MSQTCEDFACQRLTPCPKDVDQRIADGLSSPLSVFGTACGEFPFKQLIEAEDPTAELPVLFSSDNYRSSALVDTNFPLMPERLAPSQPPIQIEEYWFGLCPRPFDRYDTMCARSSTTCYLFDTEDEEWSAFGAAAQHSFKSVPGLCFSTHPATPALGIVAEQKVTSTNPANDSSTKFVAITDCQLSGDGNVRFIKHSGGWSRITSPTSFVGVGESGPQFRLHTSFDGSTFVQSNRRSPDFHYQIGSTALRSQSLGQDEYNDNDLFAAVSYRTILIARGKSVFAIGSLGTRKVIRDLPSVVVGLWADDATIWVCTDQGTLMSHNLGWTWTELKNQFAIGPGLFSKPGSDTVWAHPDQSFAEAVTYPLRLTNGGHLRDAGTWANAYQDKTMDNTKFTLVKKTDEFAVSPNGLYLLTQKDGVVTLFLNVWNSASFAAWCKLEPNDCKAAYAKYCGGFKSVDSGCKTDEPSGPGTGPGSGSPGGGSGGSKPDEPSSGFPTWAIILASTLGLGVIVGLIVALSKKSKNAQRPLITA